ncbi:MAG: hypothetical protein L6V95_08195 [Candidatus Melainabacteria bacterium]|nr:MAG: hypothetical protein L6V95_08195 [Candidatus Melainabacteria bacterium]
MVVDDSIHSAIEQEYNLDNLPPLPKTSEETKNVENKKKSPAIESVPIKYSSQKPKQNTNITKQKKKKKKLFRNKKHL